MRKHARAKYHMGARRIAFRATARRRSPCRSAPRSRLPRSPLRGPPTCPSTAYPRRGPPPCRRRSTRAARGTGRAAVRRSGVGSGMPMMPRSVSPGSRLTSRASADRCLPGRTPLFDASPLALTCTSTLSGPRSLRPRGREPLRNLQPVDTLHPVERLPPPASPCCSAAVRSDATRCPAGRRAPPAWRRLPARSSRRTRAARAHRLRAPPAAGNVFETASSVTVLEARPAARSAAAMRALAACHPFSGRLIIGRGVPALGSGTRFALFDAI